MATTNAHRGNIMYNIRIVSTYPPRRCGIATFSRDLANALEHFTGEVGTIRVSALDRESLPYDIPVDLVVDQASPQSWRDGIKHVIARASETPNTTVILLQHEYGLDPDDAGNACQGTHYVDMARAFTAAGLTTLVYLHTVLDQPDQRQKDVLQALACHSDGLIVTTESAIQLLERPPYLIDSQKLKHLDHGVRMHHRSQCDRLAIKESYHLKDRFLIATLGMLSPDKGIQYGIRAYGRFLSESCTADQRRQMVYLIAGQCHPEFVAANEGQCYQSYQNSLCAALDESRLRWCKANTLTDINFDQFDVVFLDTFLDEATLLKLYGAANVMLLPYLNMQQVSSGILADTLGAGRVAVTTKFRYALELIHSNKRCSKGLVIGRHARGILVDPEEPSVEQMAQALDYLVFHPEKRLAMERQAHQRGYQMRWLNTVWALLQHIDFVVDQRNHRTGRGPVFRRDKRPHFGTTALQTERPQAALRDHSRP